MTCSAPRSPRRTARTPASSPGRRSPARRAPACSPPSPARGAWTSTVPTPTPTPSRTSRCSKPSVTPSPSTPTAGSPLRRRAEDGGSGAGARTAYRAKSRMLALRYSKSVPRYLLMRAGAKRIKGLETGRFSPLQLEEIPEPELPTSEWVRLKPLLSGICGSDLGTLSSENSPYFSPITSPPFVLGHEVVGAVAEESGNFRAGERVVLEPALGCAVRGIEPPCRYCAAGDHALCVNVAKGTIAPGIQTGFCRDTGGGWSEGTLVAHPSQLHRVPEDVSDEAAVAIEPLACAVHAALGADPDETVLVIGAGSVGLFVVAALRQLTRAGRLICVAKHERQRKEALRLGADEVVHPKETYRVLPAMLGTESYEPEIGKPVVMGGADRVFECVGSAPTMETGCVSPVPAARSRSSGCPPRGAAWTFRPSGTRR